MIRLRFLLIGAVVMAATAYGMYAFFAVLDNAQRLQYSEVR